MPDTTANIVQIAVVALLAAGVWRQFVRAGQIGQLIDLCALVPQWRFYAQSDIRHEAGYFDDPHLLARIRIADGQPGDWFPVFWLDDRKLRDTAWNPARRSTGLLIDCLLALCENAQRQNGRVPTMTIPYLAVLRFCLDRVPLPAEGQLQFAIALTRGREPRLLAGRFQSAWHVA